MLKKIALLYHLIIFLNEVLTASPTYQYQCRLGRCIKVEWHDYDLEILEASSLEICRALCDESGTILPKPKTIIHQNSIHPINFNNIKFDISNEDVHSKFWNITKNRFIKQINAKIPDETIITYNYDITLRIIVDIEEQNPNDRINLNLNESYHLHIYHTDDDITAKVKALNYFGARHGIETLSQLIFYDERREVLVILDSLKIYDEPAFKWRGLLLDTSRNFYSIKSIKRTLDAMAMVKLNTFHWHITDTQSFPLEIKSQPDLYRLGAYSARKIYRQKDIIDIVEYGLALGIRVMPEFDAPAHVGEGWQHKDMVACLNAQPWPLYCGEPPCGQLDPTVDTVYDILEDIYREIFQIFQPDIFHMGGDEVLSKCWNSSERIRDWMLNKGWSLEEKDFMQLWSYFQNKAYKRVDKVKLTKDKLPIILWTSKLTDPPYIDQYLNKNDYIIQIWTKGDNSKVEEILKRNYRVIISNHDALYFDCGGPAWIGSGNNWCSPYIGWQKVYNNDLFDIAGKKYIDQVLGAEAAVWSEQIDEYTLDARLWPRASALAERLWTNPLSGWQEAEARMLLHRERLVENNIGAESMQPAWCLQNENECPSRTVAERKNLIIFLSYQSNKLN